MAYIEINDCSKVIKKTTILDHIDLKLEKNRIYGFVAVSYTHLAPNAIAGEIYLSGFTEYLCGARQIEPIHEQPDCRENEGEQGGPQRNHSVFAQPEIQRRGGCEQESRQKPKGGNGHFILLPADLRIDMDSAHAANEPFVLDVYKRQSLYCPCP